MHGDNYPLAQFPPLWVWMASNVTSREFSIPKVALEEVHAKSPECGAWLTARDVEQIDMSDEILEAALNIKALLGIVSDHYHAKGVGENDLFIIATARCRGFELVSDEARQLQLPMIKSKLKIPAVCALKDVGVSCVSFLELIKRSNVVFG